MLSLLCFAATVVFASAETRGTRTENRWAPTEAIVIAQDSCLDEEMEHTGQCASSVKVEQPPTNEAATAADEFAHILAETKHLRAESTEEDGDLVAAFVVPRHDIRMNAIVPQRRPDEDVMATF